MCASLFLMMSVEPRASHLLSKCPTPELFLTQRAPGSGVFSVVEGRRREGGLWCSPIDNFKSEMLFNSHSSCS